MSRIALVTDSGCDLPASVLQENNIHLVPLNLVFGDTSYAVGVDLDAEQFFDLLRSNPHHPTMSQPAPGDFAIVYDRLRHEYEHIISVHISSALSGTCNAAMIARDMFPQVDISVVDTKAASLGLAWTLLLCARAIAGGKKPAEVVALAQAVSRQQQILFTVDSLEWLQKTGRIGKASALLGSLLNWHPVLQIDDGYVAPYDRVRGSMDKVLVRMTDAMTELVGSQGPVYAGIAHAQRPELAQQLAQLLQSTYTIREQMIYSFGPIIGVNTGPGAVGCVLVPASALD